jgi:dTDP-4-amino-4,6-dideoxygalactose transaminase
MSRRRPVLALNGGPKAVRSDQAKIQQWPLVGKEELAACKRVLESGDLSFGEDVETLTREFRKIAGVKYAVCCNNGTAAGHLCYFAIGIRPGDEIIGPSFTFWASILQAMHLGGVPVFAEMDPKTLNIDPDDIERRITKRTRAIVVTHMLGLPCEMDRIMEIARRHRLVVIEDASHAHGATYKGRKIGSIGHLSFFSFQTSKLMPAGEGGIFCTNHKPYFERAIAMGHYRRAQQLDNPEWSRFGVTGLGCKYRIHPLAAAVALCQLRRLRARNRRMNALCEYFHRGLRKLRLWDVAPTPKYMRRVWYQDWQPWRPERAPGVTKERFMEALRAEGCMVRDARYNLLHQQAVFTDPWVYSKDGIFPVMADLPNKPVYRGDELPVSHEQRLKLIWLPVFPNGERKHVDEYLRAFRKVEENLDGLRGR